MKHWIFHNIEKVLVGVSVVFAAIVIVYYVSVVRTVARTLEGALDANAQLATQTTFNLDAASKLDLRGLKPNIIPVVR